MTRRMFVSVLLSSIIYLAGCEKVAGWRSKGHLFASNGQTTLLVVQEQTNAAPIVGFCSSSGDWTFRLQRNEDYSILIDVEGTTAAYVNWEDIWDPRENAGLFQRTTTVGVHLPIVSYKRFTPLGPTNDYVSFGIRGCLAVSSCGENGCYIPILPILESNQLPPIAPHASPIAIEGIFSSIPLDVPFSFMHGSVSPRIVLENVTTTEVLSFLVLHGMFGGPVPIREKADDECVSRENEEPCCLSENALDELFR